MSHRASLHPSVIGNSTTTSTAQQTKQKQLAHLAGRLGELSKRLEALDEQVLCAAGQAERAGQFAAMQAAFFMATQRTLVKVDNQDAQDQASKD